MVAKWATPDRKARLIQIQEEFGDQCLKGHRFCPVQEHWEWVRTRAEWTAVPTVYPVVDKATGGIRRDVFRNGWLPVQMPVYEVELASLGDAKVEEIIASWVTEDRQAAADERRRAGQTLNDGMFGKYGSRFDPVARDVYAQGKAEYYLVAMGMDGVHFSPVAVVKIPGTEIQLHVDVSKAFRTRSQRRHARRHGKPEVTIETLCHQAVQAWWHR